jgi:hypothetical protein
VTALVTRTPSTVSATFAVGGMHLLVLGVACVYLPTWLVANRPTLQCLHLPPLPCVSPIATMQDEDSIYRHIRLEDGATESAEAGTTEYEAVLCSALHVLELPSICHSVLQWGIVYTYFEVREPSCLKPFHNHSMCNNTDPR